LAEPRHRRAPAAVAGVQHIIFTAGCRSGRPARRRRIKRTEFDGVANPLAAAKRAGFDGRSRFDRDRPARTVR